MDAIVAKLEKTRSTIDSLAASASSGVYAVFLREDVEFPITEVPHNGLIYIGRSSNLASREYDAHFSSSNTGLSTLRRSIGALLKNELKLQAMPTGDGTDEKDYQNYCFESTGEKRLTDWMTHNLEVGVCTIGDGYKDVEKQLIRELRPVLCLIGCENPFAPEIRSLRKKCSEEARARKGKVR